MQLSLVGSEAAYVCDWGSFALLRDNVQHYMEQGEPTDRFRALHSVETVIDSDPRQVDAARLRGEVLRAWGALGQWTCRVRRSASGRAPYLRVAASCPKPGTPWPPRPPAERRRADPYGCRPTTPCVRDRRAVWLRTLVIASPEFWG